MPEINKFLETLVDADRATRMNAQKLTDGSDVPTFRKLFTLEDLEN